jgi:drug/metabolite transporter (DMT)-like permease
LFLFTLIGVGAAVALFFKVFLSRPSEQTSGVFLLIFAALCYAAAEVAVSQVRLHRYGIEEALAVCSVGFLCVGMQTAFSAAALIQRSRTEPSSWFPPPEPSFRSGYGAASAYGMHFSPR